VQDPTIASLRLAKQRELQLQLEMLSCRGTDGFLPLSIELFGAVSPALREEAGTVLATVPTEGSRDDAWLDADAFVRAAQHELDHYRSTAPDIESRIQVREGSSGVMVSNGDVLVAPNARIAASRLDALLQHEIGTHVVTYVNGAHQPLRVLATGLAGHEETQEGLAVLAEHLVRGLTVGRVRQLAARVVAVDMMVGGAEFPDVHRALVAAGLTHTGAFNVTMRVFRSGGLTKDAVYFRGLRDIVAHIRDIEDIDVLWLGKLPLAAAPLVADLHQQGVLRDPLLRPRYLGDPTACARLAAVCEMSSLTELLGGLA
jgi:uncharacterized protein (TIGR02421 family)